MKRTRLFDSSAWLSYFFGENEAIKHIIDSDEVLYASIISLFETKRKFLLEKIKTEAGNKAMSFVKEQSIVST